MVTTSISEKSVSIMSIELHINNDDLCESNVIFYFNVSLTEMKFEI